MAIQSYALTPGRLEKFKGEILKHAVPREILAKLGRQVQMPRNNSKNYVARRWLPYGATATNANTINRFFADGTGDRGNVMVQAHQTSDGVTPPPDSIAPQDVTVTIIEYACLYGFTNQTYDLYEDDIPEAMQEQIGERVALVNEMINWGALRASTNQFYAGTGTSIATVNSGITLGMVRRISKGLMANHSVMVNKVLKAGPNFGTEAVAEGFTVICHTDLEPDIRDLPNFVPSESYGSGIAMEYEIGKCERFRFITHPDLIALQDAGAAVASASGYQSTTGANIDVYSFIVVAQDAWSQLAVRGRGSLDPTFISPGEKSKSDPLGQRGYAGTKWYKAVLLENQGWMAIGNCGVKILT
jgi:N4-gp56 family major capsid protein